ncbi:hypothetical protein JB92DRAFT_2921410 [Gautieria morchelliformis]|nr:hypothetical protein JB92DRAFT_2921410 [Gautieria morchelliformis]
MSETVNFEASSVKLPPAAFRLDTLDFDPTGNPYYKFPPFLSPPAGTPLIPFDKFEASGIEICFESDDVEEVDGEGIPTIELASKHGPGGDTDRRKRKKRPKNGDDSRKGGPWWEQWREGEDMRRADCYDPNVARTDRFSQGAHDFLQNRHWTPILQSLYDHFRHFAGLLGNATKNYRYGKGKGGDADEDDDDDEEELAVEQEKQAAEEINPLSKPLGAGYEEEPKLREIDEDYQAELEAKEMKMDAFLNDPERATKIFFSSFYKDKGLWWSETKLRDGPILLSFFFSFFIRNRLMPDYEKAFRKATKVTEMARLELPQSTKISMAIPDTLANACVALWGSKQAWKQKYATDADDGSWPTSAPAPVKEWEEALKEQGVEQVTANFDAGEPGLSDHWGAPTEGVEEGPIMGGWGDSAKVIEGETNPWGAPGATTDWAVEEPKPCLMSILGPTTIPLTHSIQLVEQSTRQIVSIAPPNPDDKGLGRILGTVMFAPWKNPKEKSDILPPQLLSGLPEGSTFDVARDEIKVFVLPKTIEVLRVGMGLHAVFVQVTENENEAGREVVKEKKSKSRNKGKGKAKGSDDRQWWYMEFLYEVVPSFWTEEED